MRSAVKQLKRQLKPLKCDPQSNLCSCNLGLVWVLLMWLWCDSLLRAKLLYKWLCLSVCLNTVSFSSFPAVLHSFPSPSFNYPLSPTPFPAYFHPPPFYPPVDPQLLPLSLWYVKTVTYLEIALTQKISSSLLWTMIFLVK